MAVSSYQPYYEASHALVVGIDAYEKLQPLETAVYDAEAVAGALRDDLGFEVTLLRNAEATRNAIFGHIEMQFSQTGPDDRVLVYFAGHGITRRAASGHKVGYLIPHGVDRREYHLAAKMDDLIEHSDFIPAKHIIFILDACFSGLALTRSDPPVGGRLLADLMTRRAVQAIAAGQQDQLVAERWGPGGHSIFTGLLLDRLTKHGGLLTGNELGLYLQRRVGIHTHANQTPHYGHLLGSQGGDFVFWAEESVIRLPPEIRDAVGSPLPGVRAGVVSDLRFLLESGSTEMAQLAHKALRRLTRDDSRRVSQAAREALGMDRPPAAAPPKPPVEVREARVEAPAEAPARPPQVARPPVEDTPVVEQPPVEVRPPSPPPRARVRRRPPGPSLRSLLKSLQPAWIGIIGALALAVVLVGALLIAKAIRENEPAPTPQVTEPGEALAARPTDTPTAETITPSGDVTGTIGALLTQAADDLTAAAGTVVGPTNGPTTTPDMTRPAVTSTPTKPPPTSVSSPTVPAPFSGDGVLLDVPYRSSKDPATAGYSYNDVGITCVAMLLAADGQNVTTDQIYQDVGITTKAALSVTTVKGAGNYYGLGLERYDRSSGASMDALKEWTQDGYPAIVLIDYNVIMEAGYHESAINGGSFVLVVGYDDDYVYVHDPHWEGTGGSYLPWRTTVFEKAWYQSGTQYQNVALVPLGESEAVQGPPPTTQAGYTADGFDSPVGTTTERRSAEVWPGDWYDATGFATYYSSPTPTYHTGADLNLPKDADRLQPVYAAASGEVMFSGTGSGAWGWLIIIRHDPLLSTGEVVWTRYAHVADALVETGERVERGQQIASIGNADGMMAYFLGFDIAQTDVLEENPGYWPGADLSAVLQHFVDPRQFIEEHRPAE
jgi:uncharacterized protein YvpB